MRYAILFIGLCLLATGIFYSAAETDAFTEAQRTFWSLQPVKKPAIPTANAKQLADVQSPHRPLSKHAAFTN